MWGLKSEHAQHLPINWWQLDARGLATAPDLERQERSQVMTKPERNFDDDSYDEVEERLREQDPDEEDRAYFPVEESKPPHYWKDAYQG